MSGLGFKPRVRCIEDDQPASRSPVSRPVAPRGHVGAALALPTHGSSVRPARRFLPFAGSPARTIGARAPDPFELTPGPWIVFRKAMELGKLCSQPNGQTLLAGHGCNEQGPYLVIDDLTRAPWQRQIIFVRQQTFTFSRCEEQHCVGRHDLETGRGLPCPEQARLGGDHEQCTACFAATGFNPAFYNAPRISRQQRRRNLEPHVVYLVSFGVGVLKVGMTHAPRQLSRLLEQGARLGAVIARLPDADLARELEASIAGGFEVSEFVRATRKRHLLSAPLALAAARRELAATLARVADRHPEVLREPPLLDLDRYYFGDQRVPTALTDLSETEPHSISGRCIGMIGDVLVLAQADRHYMLSLGGSIGHRVRIEAHERENRFTGQLGFAF